jgi:hypothetical protein
MKIRLQLLAFVLLLPMMPVHGQEQTKTLMPEGFDAIRLGMSWADVIAARPEAKIPFSGLDDKEPSPDPNKPERMLMERLDSGGPFQGVLYLFKNDSLAGVSWGATPNSANRTFVLRHMARHWGQPTRVLLPDKEFKEPSIIGQDSNTFVAAIVPPDDAITSKSTVTFLVAQSAYARENGMPGSEDAQSTATLTLEQKSRTDLLQDEYARLVDEAKREETEKRDLNQP